MAKIEEKSPADATLDQAGIEITKELRELRGDLAALVASLQRFGALGAEALKGRAQDLADDSLSGSMKAVRNVRHQMEALQGRVQGDVRAHPLAWLVGALGLGMMFGLLVSRRHWWIAPV